MALKEFLRSINGIVNRLAIVAVVTVFCGIFVFPLFYSREDAKTAKTELAAIGKALGEYHAETGAWPSSSGGRSVAEALAGGAKIFSDHERRDDDGRFIDPWETPYRFFFSSGSYVLQSAGPDGKFEPGVSGGGDDYWFSPE